MKALQLSKVKIKIQMAMSMSPFRKTPLMALLSLSLSKKGEQLLQALISQMTQPELGCIERMD